MLGISYGGISQLFTAQLQPPDLAAIAPLSVIDATATTLYPGGIRNDGFAVAWAEERQQNAEPAGPGHGQAWAYKRDPGRRPDVRGQPGPPRRGRQPDEEDRRKLDVQPEGGRSARPGHVRQQDQRSDVHGLPVRGRADRRSLRRTWSQHFTGTSHKWFTFTNGAHIDSLDPYTYNRMYDFLRAVRRAQQAPIVNAAVVQAAAPVIYKEAMGLPESDVVTLPPDPIQTQPTYESALSAFEALPSVRVLFDNGAGEAPPGGTTAAGNPYPGFEQSFSDFPIPGTTAQSWYLGSGGTLNELPV